MAHVSAAGSWLDMHVPAGLVVQRVHYWIESVTKIKQVSLDTVDVVTEGWCFERHENAR